MAKNIKKTMIVSILILLLIALVLTLNILTAKDSAIDYSTYTKAVCNEDNLCQDFIFTCKDGEVIEQTPITGAIVQFDSDWIDPRSN